MNEAVDELYQVLEKTVGIIFDECIFNANNIVLLLLIVAILLSR